MMKKVVFLPVTPGKHQHFTTLLGPLIADIVARICQAPLEVVLNTNSAFYSTDDAYSRYLNQLERMEICLSYQDYDKSRKYCDFIKGIVRDLLQRGALIFSQERLAVCQCGKVEIPQKALQNLLKQNRGRLVEFNGKIRCTDCKSELNIEKQEVLKVVFCQNQVSVNVQPQRCFQEFVTIKKRLQEIPFIISRNHRTGQKVFLKEKEVILDADFRWMAYLNYLSSLNTHICLIAGSNCLNHATKIICLAHLIDPTLRFSLIVHPLVEVVDQRKELSGLDIDEYLEICQSPAVARTFLCLGIHWSQERSILTSNELYMVQQSVFPEEIIEHNTVKRDVDFTEIKSFFNRSELLNLLKSLRAKKKITSQQVVLKNSVLLIK